MKNPNSDSARKDIRKEESGVTSQSGLPPDYLKRFQTNGGHFPCPETNITVQPLAKIPPPTHTSAEVRIALNHQGSSSDIVGRCGSDKVSRRNLQTLAPGQWLSDEVIHCWYSLLAKGDATTYRTHGGSGKRSHFFKSFFFTSLLKDGKEGSYCYDEVKSWSKKVPGGDIFELDKIIVPCNCDNMHWTCLCVYMQKRSIVYYDSMHYSMKGKDQHFLSGMMHYIKEEHKTKKRYALPYSESWSLVTDPLCPQQENNHDCGVFSCMIAECLSKNVQPDFTQQDVTRNARSWIVTTILHEGPPHPPPLAPPPPAETRRRTPTATMMMKTTI